MATNTNDKMGQFDDILTAFLKGELNPEQESEFLQQLQREPELKTHAIAVARLFNGMKKVGEDEDAATISALRNANAEDVKTLLAEVCATKNSTPQIISFKKFVVALSIAASLLLCVFGGYRYYQYDKVSSLGQEYLGYFPASEFSRGESAKISSELKRLYASIEVERDIKESIISLSTMWIESRSEIYNDYTEFMPEIGWMLANCYLLDNNKEKAINTLKILEEEYPKDTAMGDKVRELQHRILEL